MENTSKALLIAASILILVIIITVGIKIFSSGADNVKVAKNMGESINSKTTEATDFLTLEMGGKLPMNENNVKTQIGRIYQAHKDSENLASKMQSDLRSVFDDNTINVTESSEGPIVALKLKGENKKYIYNKSTNLVENKSVIDFVGKTKDTIEVGDDIIIETERFRVGIKTTNKIIAIPYYNIELKTDNPKQSIDAGTIEFSSEKYWEGGKEIDIDMFDSRNNIQKYINAYKQTLNNMGAVNVIVRISTYNEMNAIPRKERAPKYTTPYWIGTANPYGYRYINVNSTKVHMIYGDGNLDGTYYGYSYNQKIRSSPSN